MYSLSPTTARNTQVGRQLIQKFYITSRRAKDKFPVVCPNWNLNTFYYLSVKKRVAKSKPFLWYKCDVVEGVKYCQMKNGDYYHIMKYDIFHKRARQWLYIIQSSHMKNLLDDELCHDAMEASERLTSIFIPHYFALQYIEQITWWFHFRKLQFFTVTKLFW